ncbi:MAG: hypothetical protein WC554_08445 [Clostridia bacterium]
MYTKEEYLIHFDREKELEDSIDGVRQAMRENKQPVYDRLLELIKYLRKIYSLEDDHYYQLYNSSNYFDKDMIYIDITIHIPRYGDKRITWEVTIDEFCDSDFIPRLIREQGRLF